MITHPINVAEVLRWIVVDVIGTFRFHQSKMPSLEDFFEVTSHNLVAHWTDIDQQSYSVSVRRARDRVNSGVLSIREILDLAGTPPCPKGVFPTAPGILERAAEIDNREGMLWEPRESQDRLIVTMRWAFLLLGALYVGDVPKRVDEVPLDVDTLRARLADPDPAIENHLTQCASLALIVESGVRPDFLEQFTEAMEPCTDHGGSDGSGLSIRGAIGELMTSLSKDRGGNRTKD